MTGQGTQKTPPSILFLGCNTDQVPYLKVAKQKGYRVVGTDVNDGAPGISLLDTWKRVGYDDIHTLIEVGKKEGFSSGDKVFTASSQHAYIGASAFAHAFQIPFVSEESVLLCLDKTKLYPLFEKYGLSVPVWSIYQGESSLDAMLAEHKVMYLKSDFGKSPNYCFRVTKDGDKPHMPHEHDRFWRESFIVQKEVLGTHYRVNWIGGTVYSFRKETDQVSRPAPAFTLGNAHKKIASMLENLGLSNHLIKFDVIEKEGELYFIDIGLEPPSRLALYLSYLGYDFPRMYFEHLVEGKVTYPDPQSLKADVTIRGKEVVDGV